MPEENQDKTFDVSRPQAQAPSANSRPIIVGHHPTIADPMLRTAPRPMAPNPAPNPEQPTPVPGIPPQVEPSSPFGNPSQPLAPPEPFSPQPISTPPLPINGHSNDNGSSSSSIKWVILVVFALLVGAYLIIDSGLITNSINLPFHVFKQDKNNGSSSPQPVSSATPPAASQTSIPAGFDQYKDSSVPFTFDYPTAWGQPTAVTEPGFSKRGGTNKSDGTYAVTINFATNKDVQIVATSGKYLPVVRTALYYDFGQWCIGSSDSKIYKSALRFTSAAGVDTATTMVCDQGPLNDASKLTTAIITQPQVKDSAGKVMGDIYTANLDSAAFPVLRVKDVAMTNSTDIKILLGTIH